MPGKVIPLTAACPICGGSGRLSLGLTEPDLYGTCPECNGKKRIPVEKATMLWRMRTHLLVLP